MEKQLLTMAQIAKQLELAESTARFFRDRFENYIPLRSDKTYWSAIENTTTF